jgi:hypothetical protein
LTVHGKYTPLVVGVVLLIPIATQPKLVDLPLQPVGMGATTLTMQVLALQILALAAAVRRRIIEAVLAALAS